MQPAPEELPLWFPFFFVGLWLGVGALLSQLSGWPRLAQRFRAANRPPGQVLKRQVAKIGLVSEGGVTHMIVSPEGLYLWTNPLFRFLRPPLMIPWTAITGVREARWLWLKMYVLNVADITTIQVSRRALCVLRPYLPIPNLAA